MPPGRSEPTGGRCPKGCPFQNTREVRKAYAKENPAKRRKLAVGSSDEDEEESEEEESEEENGEEDSEEESEEDMRQP